MNGEFDNSLKRSKDMSTRIPGAGHACCLEDPATFDEATVRFLRKSGFV
jgi:pimeloyl-ACP methyl ester carboxylesterase